MRVRDLRIGSFGGGTGLPSLLGGLKHNPWLQLNAVVTMFDSGGSSGVLRDELGVLPPGDVLRCALALAPNESEARRVLLTRLPTLEHKKLGGHTGGNLLLSMMEQYSGDFLSAVDGLRALLGCQGAVWPISVERSSLCAAVQRRQSHARGGGGRRVAGAGASRDARVAGAAGGDSPRGSGGDPRLRRRDDRPGELLHQPHADLPGGRRRRGHRRGGRPRDPTSATS